MIFLSSGLSKGTILWYILWNFRFRNASQYTRKALVSLLANSLKPAPFCMKCNTDGSASDNLWSCFL